MTTENTTTKTTAEAPAAEAKPSKKRTVPKAVTTLAARFVELTLVEGEERTNADDNDIDFGEDDGLPARREATPPAELTQPFLTQSAHIRYFHQRRDGRAGAEVWFVNGSVYIVQDTLDALADKLPTFVKLSSKKPLDTSNSIAGSAVPVYINPSNFRNAHPQLRGQSLGDHKTLINFPNGNKLPVMESYDEVKSLLLPN